jgi:hypothetical protein
VRSRGYELLNEIEGPHILVRREQHTFACIYRTYSSVERDADHSASEGAHIVISCLRNPGPSADVDKPCSIARLPAFANAMLFCRCCTVSNVGSIAVQPKPRRPGAVDPHGRDAIVKWPRILKLGIGILST